MNDREKRLINENNTVGGLQKIWTGNREIKVHSPRYTKARGLKLRHLAAKILTDLEQLQFPSSPTRCTPDERLLVCSYNNKATGIGSKIEKMLYCLNTGLETARRVIFVEEQTYIFVDPYFERVWDPCRDHEFRDSYKELPLYAGKDLDFPVIWVDGKRAHKVPVTPALKYFEGANFFPDNPVAWYAGIIVNRMLTFKPKYRELFAARVAKIGMNLPGEPKLKSGDVFVAPSVRREVQRWSELLLYMFEKFS